MIAAVQQAFPQVSIRQLCRWLGLGRTWYYTRPTPEERAARDVALRDAIERIILAFPGYGYRRVTHALHREGWAVNHKRVLRIMPQEAVRRRCCASCDASLWRRRTPRMATRPIPIGGPISWCRRPIRSGSPTLPMCDCRPPLAIWPVCSMLSRDAVVAGSSLGRLTPS